MSLERTVRIFTMEECVIGPALTTAMGLPDEYHNKIGFFVYDSTYNEHSGLFERIPEQIDEEESQTAIGAITQLIRASVASPQDVSESLFSGLLEDDCDDTNRNWYRGFHRNISPDQLAAEFEKDGFNVLRGLERMEGDSIESLLRSTLEQLCESNNDLLWSFLLQWLHQAQSRKIRKVLMAWWESCQTWSANASLEVLEEMATIDNPSAKECIDSVLKSHGKVLRNGELFPHPLLAESSNPKTKPGRLLEILRDHIRVNTHITSALADNPSLTEKMLQVLSKKHPGKILANPAFEPYRNHKSRHWVACREFMARMAPNQYSEHMEKLIQDPEEQVRIALALNEQAHPRILELLSYSKSDRVQLNLAYNHSTAFVTLRALAESPNQEIRSAARSHYKFVEEMQGVST